MTITTVDQFYSAARQSIQIQKVSAITSFPSFLYSTAYNNGNPPAMGSILNTYTGVAVTDATTGFPPINTFPAGNVGYLAKARFRNSIASGLILYDRLWHLGACPLDSLYTSTIFSGATPRTPTTNEMFGLELFLEVQAPPGMPTSVSVSYLDHAGVTRTATFTFGAGEASGYLVPLPLRTTSPNSINRVTEFAVTGSPGTGSINVVLARRLADFYVRNLSDVDSQAWDVLGAPIVYDTSALWPVIAAIGTTTGTPTLELTIVNG